MKNLIKNIIFLNGILIISLSSFASNTGDRRLEKNEYTKTKYPIVLAHGLFGFDEILEFYDYWFLIPANLRRSGSEVYVTQVSAANNSEVRGEQLLKIVENIIANSDAEKVNLIGHSHGSNSIRYVAAMAPELVASVTSVGGSNGGNQFADFFVNLFNIPVIGSTVVRPVVSIFGNLGTGLIDFFTTAGGRPQNIAGALYDLSDPGISEFNEKYPFGMPSRYCQNDGQAVVDIIGRDGQPHSVHYFSWSGDALITNYLDLNDYSIFLTGSLILQKKGEKNDGQVTVCASHLGRVVKDNYQVNHFDQVNQILGLKGSDNPITIWRTHANRLKKYGL